MLLERGVHVILVVMLALGNNALPCTRIAFEGYDDDLVVTQNIFTLSSLSVCSCHSTINHRFHFCLEFLRDKKAESNVRGSFLGVGHRQALLFVSTRSV